MDLGPHDGTLTLHTGRSGVASKVGHDLTLTVTRWTVTGDPAKLITLTAELGSLVVSKGDGGLKPLSDKDKATILGHAASTLKAADHPLVTAIIAGPVAVGTATAEVSIAGRSQQVPITVATEGDNPARVVVTATVVQTAFGIKPYSGLLGTLKVADPVGVRFEATVR